MYIYIYMQMYAHMYVCVYIMYKDTCAQSHGRVVMGWLRLEGSIKL